MSEAADAPLPGAAATGPALLSGRIEFLAAARRLVTDTRYNASLFTQRLDPRVFGDRTFADAVKQLLLMQRYAHLRVLVVEPQQATRAPHALLELGRLLTSRIEFREVAPGRPAPPDEWLLADGRLLLERNGNEAVDARLFRDDPATARERQRRFDNLWDHAVPSAELRRLRL